MTDAAEVWADLTGHIDDKTDGYERHLSYYHGEQDLPVNPAEFRSRFGNVFAAFRDNLARPIIDVAEGRLRFTEFGVGTGVAEDALGIWRRSRMHVESKWVHTDALVMGDSYVMVLPDRAGQPTIWPQPTTQTAIAYDPENPREKRAALKFWIEDHLSDGYHTTRPHVRANLYFADRIETYRSTQSSERFVDVLGSYELVDKTDHPLGEVPVYRFAANWDQTHQDSRSDLADATGLIDAVVKTLLDMLVASEYTAAPQRWATGVEIPLDPKTGEPQQSYRAGADRLWTAPSEDARFGQFPAGAMDGFAQAVQLLVDQLAYVTSTPTYALMRSDTFSSDLALKTSETPLRQRVADHQAAFGNTWGQVLSAALRLKGITVEPGDVEPAWVPVNAPFVTRELLEEVKVKVEVTGVPEEQAWAELGYDQGDIARMKTMREEQSVVGQVAAADLAADQALNVGAGSLTAGVADDLVGLPTNLIPQPQ